MYVRVQYLWPGVCVNAQNSPDARQVSFKRCEKHERCSSIRQNRVEASLVLAKVAIDVSIFRIPRT